LGIIEPAKRLNGSSGKWVDDNVLCPLNISRQVTYLIDCLDTYRCSIGLAARLKDTYEPLALKYGWPAYNLLPHPDENKIVSEALACHRDRLNNELASAHPELVVTLGNAALRVFKELALEISPEASEKLSLWPGFYGRRFRVKLSSGRYADWIPLAHPAAPPRYQQAHYIWVKSLVK
jgi:uracil-DNA glycosylase